MTTANQRQRAYRKSKRAASTPDAIDLTNRRAVIYVRISKNRDNETSTESQESIARDWAKRNGVDVVAAFVDAGESAYQGKAPRPQFRKALDVIQSRAANTLIVYKLDRFMRDASTAVALKEEIHGNGGSIVSATEGIDTADRSNGTADLIFSVLAWLAEMESNTKSDRIRDWHAGRYTNPTGALPAGGPRPFGYERAQLTRDGKTESTLVIVEDEARIITLAAKRILAGDGLRGVAMDLSTPERKISRSGLKHILTSETTAGLRYDGTQHHVGNWSGILDRDTWQRLGTLLNDPERLTSGPRGERRHFLAGLMTCGKCGSPMRSRNHAKGMRYICASAPQCNNAINASAAESAVSDFIFATVAGDAWKAMQNAGRGFDPTVIEGYENRLRKITGLYAAGDMEDDEYETGRAVILEGIRKAQESEYVNLPDVEDVEASWPTLPIDGKRLIVNAALESITVAPWVRNEEPRTRLAIVQN